MNDIARIANALERIASALEPSKNDSSPSIHDLLAQLNASLCEEDSLDGSLSRIHACFADFLEAFSGGMIPESTALDHLETIAHRS